MNLIEIFDSPLCARLCLALAHSLWVGTLIAALSAIAAKALGSQNDEFRSTKGVGWKGLRSSRIRYAVYMSGLLIMAMSVVVSFALVEGPTSMPDSGTNPIIEAIETPMESPVVPVASVESPAVAPKVDIPPPLSPPPVESIAPAPAAASRRSLDWQHLAPYATSFYLLGVILMLGRLLVGLHGGSRLRRSSQPVDDPAILAALAKQAKALGLAFTPAVAYCRRVVVPTVVGVLKPTILLPFSFATGLAPDQIEMLLAHELAHIRRYDPLFNIIQRLIEAVLFYHPAVWFISRKIRMERENCCDDIVLALGGRPLTYASSLISVAERGKRRPRLAAEGVNAASRSSQLGSRIRRLIGASGHEQMRLRRSWFLALVLGCLLLPLLGIGLNSNEDSAGPASLEIQLLDPGGSPLSAFSVVPASKGFTETFPKLTRWPDRDGWAVWEELDPGEYLFAVATSASNRSVLQLRVPEGGLKTRFQLGPEPRWQGVEPGKPSVEGNLIRVPLENRSDETKTFRRDHLTLCSMDYRIFPPFSEEEPIIIPAKGETLASIDWAKWVKEGIWASRTGEDIREKWLADDPEQGKIYMRAWLGNSASLPVALSKPEIVLASTAEPETDEATTASKWTQTVSHRVEVSLVAVGRPSRDPDLWWDPDGEPIATDPEWVERWERYGVREGLAAVFQIEYSEQYPPTDDYVPIQKIVRPVGDPAPRRPATVSLGVDHGPWRTVKVSEGGELTEGDFSCGVTKVIPGRRKNNRTGLGGSITVDAWYTVMPDRHASLQVVDKSGNAHDVYVYLSLTVDKREAGTIHQLHQPVRNIDADNVDHFLFGTRPRTWVTFTGFAAQPLSKPERSGASEATPMPPQLPPRRLPAATERPEQTGNPLTCRVEMAKTRLAFLEPPQFIATLTNEGSDAIDVIGYADDAGPNNAYHPLPCATVYIANASGEYSYSSYGGLRPVPNAIRIEPGGSWTFRLPPPPARPSPEETDGSRLLSDLAAPLPGKYTAQVIYFVREAELEKFGPSLVYSQTMGQLAGHRPDSLWQGTIKSNVVSFEVADDDSETLRIRRAVESGRGVRDYLRLELKPEKDRVGTGDALPLTLAAENTGPESLYLGSTFGLHTAGPDMEWTDFSGPRSGSATEIEPGNRKEIGGWNLGSGTLLAPGDYRVWVEYYPPGHENNAPVLSNVVTLQVTDWGSDARGRPRLRLRLVAGKDETGDFEQVPWHDPSAMPRTPLPLHAEVLFDETDVESVGVRASPGNDDFYLSLELTDEARQRFAEVTGNNIGKRLAIVVDGRIYSAPVIRERIPYGKVQITGDTTREEAEALALAIAGNDPSKIEESEPGEDPARSDRSHRELQEKITTVLLEILRDPEEEPLWRARAAFALAGSPDKKIRAARLEFYSDEEMPPAAQSDDRPLEDLIAGSKHEREKVRFVSVQLLDWKMSPEAIEPLTARLSDESPLVRMAAANGLGNLARGIDDPRIVSALLNAMTDENGEVRRAAVYGLGHTYNERAVAPLVNGLRDPEAGPAAALALGELRDRRALDPLLEALGSEDSVLRANAATALGRIGNPSVATRLRRSARNDDARRVREAASRALVQIETLNDLETGEDWGKPVAGVRCRLYPDRQVFPIRTRKPPIFKIDLSCEQQKLLPHYGPPIHGFGVELDGEWYEANYEFHSGLASVHPSLDYKREGLHFGLRAKFWWRVTDGSMMALSPGRHVMRVSFPFEEGSETLRAMSNPIAFEVRAAVETTERGPWGEPVDGVSVRIWHSGNVSAGTDAPLFRVELRSETERMFFYFGHPLASFEMEVDGRWYNNNYETVGGHLTTRYFPIDDILLSPEPPPANPLENFGWYRMEDGAPFSKLEPGKHTLRVRYHFTSEKGGRRERLWAMSNPVEFEILPVGQGKSSEKVGEAGPASLPPPGIDKPEPVQDTLERRRVHVPDADAGDPAMILDFASGELLTNEEARGREEASGDLVFDGTPGGAYIACIRGAKLGDYAADGFTERKPDLDAAELFVAGYMVKTGETYHIRTTDGRIYAFTIVSFDEKGAEIDYWKPLPGDTRRSESVPRLQFRLVAPEGETENAEELFWSEPLGDREGSLFLEPEILFDQSDIEAIGPRKEGDTDRFFVSLQFTEEAKERFAKVTARNIRRRLAIVFDGEIYAAPVIVDRIPYGRIQIVGDFTREEAEELARAIAGDDPAKFRTSEELESSYEKLRREMEEKSIEELLDLLRDPEGDPRTRQAAGQVLGTKKDTGAIRPLLEMLKHEDEMARMMAAQALREIGEPAALGILAAVEDDDPRVRRGAVWALGGIPTEKAANILVERLSDEEGEVRAAAAMSLANLFLQGMMSERAVSALANALDDESGNVRGAAVAALSLTRDSQFTERILGALDDADMDVRRYAAAALGRMKEKRAVDPLIETLKSDDGMLRLVAVQALSQISDSRAIDPLTDLATSDSDPRVRAAAKEAVARFADLAAEEEAVAWGRSVQGVQLGLRCTSGNRPYQYGEIVEYEILVRNKSGGPVRVGKVVSDVRWSSEVHDGRIDLKGGTWYYSDSDIQTSEQVIPAGETASIETIAHTIRPPGYEETDSPPTLHVEPGVYDVSTLYSIVGRPGGEVLVTRHWPWPPHAPTAMAAPIFPCGTLTLRVIGDTPESRATGEDGNSIPGIMIPPPEDDETWGQPVEGVAWGKAVQGVQLGLRCTSGDRNYRYGEAVEYEVLVRNSREGPVSVGKVTGEVRCPSVVGDSRIDLKGGTCYYSDSYQTSEQVIPAGETASIETIAHTIRPTGYKETDSPPALHVEPGAYDVGMYYGIVGRPGKVLVTRHWAWPSVTWTGGTIPALYSGTLTLRIVDDAPESGATEEDEKSVLRTGMSTPGDDEPWGAPAEGVRVRVRPDGQVFSEDTTPTFKIDLRSEKEIALPHYGPPLDEFEIELDGEAYRGDYARWELARSVLPSPAKERNGLNFLFRPRDWHGLTDGAAAEFTLGEHTLRVRFPIPGRETSDGERLWAVSNPVRFEIAAMGDTGSTGTGEREGPSVPPPPSKPESELPDVRWGEAVNGLQLGLRCTTGDRPYRFGQALEYELLLRNHTQQEATFRRWIGHTWYPFVQGNHLYLKGGVQFVRTPTPEAITVPAGDTRSVERIAHTIRPATWSQSDSPQSLQVQPGQYTVSVCYYLGPTAETLVVSQLHEWDPNIALNNLCSGTLTLLVLDDADVPQPRKGETKGRRLELRWVAKEADPLLADELPWREGLGRWVNTLRLRKDVAFEESDVEFMTLIKRSGEPFVSLALNDEATRRFAKLSPESIGRRMAIVFDDEIYSAPLVTATFHDGKVRISGRLTADQAGAITRAISKKDNLNPPHPERAGDQEAGHDPKEDLDGKSVDALVEILRNPDEPPEVRAAAVAVLGTRQDPRVIEILIGLIRDGDYESKHQAADAIAGIGEPALERLLQLLQDADPQVRWPAARALGRIIDPRSVEPLITCLSDEMPPVKIASADSLRYLLGEGISDERIVPALLDASADEDANVRAAVILALQDTEDPRAGEAIIRALNDPARHVRQTAALSVGLAREDRAVDPLIQALDSDDWMLRVNAAIALEHIGDPRALQPLARLAEQDPDSRVRDAARRAVSRIESVPSNLGDIHWGEEAQGLQLGLRCITGTQPYRFGEEVEFQVILRNVTNRDVSVSWMKGRGGWQIRERDLAICIYALSEVNSDVSIEKLRVPTAGSTVLGTVHRILRPPYADPEVDMFQVSPGQRRAGAEIVLITFDDEDSSSIRTGVFRTHTTTLSSGTLSIQIEYPPGWGWGEPVGGIRTRLRPNGPAFQATDWPTFQIDVQSERELSLPEHQARAEEVELDGQWHRQATTESGESPRVPVVLTRTLERQGLRFTLIPDAWVRVNDGTPMQLTPGKHALRVASQVYRRGQFRKVISNSVTFEILPGEGTGVPANPPATARKEHVRKLFHLFTREGIVPEENRVGGALDVLPKFEWDDIPTLLELAESTELLAGLPKLAISSHISGRGGYEGMVALWLIDGIRRKQASLRRHEQTGEWISPAYYKLSLNPIVYVDGMETVDCELSPDIHRETLEAYRNWWQRVAHLPPQDAAVFDPMDGSSLNGFGRSSAHWGEIQSYEKPTPEGFVAEGTIPSKEYSEEKGWRDPDKPVCRAYFALEDDAAGVRPPYKKEDLIAPKIVLYYYNEEGKEIRTREVVLPAGKADSSHEKGADIDRSISPRRVEHGWRVPVSLTPERIVFPESSFTWQEWKAGPPRPAELADPETQVVIFHAEIDLPYQKVIAVMDRLREWGIKSVSLVTLAKEPLEDTTGIPAGHAVVGDGSAESDLSWGEPVEGVQIRVKPEKTVWKAAEVPIVRAEGRNTGTRPLHLPENGVYWQIEVDGQWYHWNINGEVKTPQVTKLLEFMPGDSHSEIAIPVTDEYQQVRDATELADLVSRRIHGGPVFPEQRQALTVQPGKHTIRVACIATPARAGIYTPVRAISNPVEIEILPAEVEKSSGTSKEKSAREALAEAAARREHVARVFHQYLTDRTVPEEDQAPGMVMWPNFKWTDIPYLLQLAESTNIIERMPASLISSIGGGKGIEGLAALWFIEGLRNQQLTRLRERQTPTGDPSPCSGKNIMCTPLNAAVVKQGGKIEDSDMSPELHRQALEAYQQWWSVVHSLPPDDASVFDPFDLTDLEWFGEQRWEDRGELQFLDFPTIEGYVAWRRIRSLKHDDMKGGADRYLPDKVIRTIYYGLKGSQPAGMLRDKMVGVSLPSPPYELGHLVTHIVIMHYYDDSGKEIRKRSVVLPQKEKTDARKEFLGLDLSVVPHTTDWAELPDIFEERPPGSKSYHVRDDVVVARHPEKWILGEVLYIPRLDRFYVQSDPIGSSTLTYYGPFNGEPWERLGIPEPKTEHGKLDIHEFLEGLPEVGNGEGRRNIPAEARDRLVAALPESGDSLLGVIAIPDDPLHRRAVNALVNIWEHLTPVQIDEYLRKSMTAYVKTRPEYPEGVNAWIETGYGIRYGWGGHPGRDMLPMRTTTRIYLDGEEYREPFRYEWPAACTGWVQTGDLPRGSHSTFVVTYYEAQYGDRVYTGRVKSEEAFFEIVSADTPDHLAAPADPQIDKLVRDSLKINEVEGLDDKDDGVFVVTSNIPRRIESEPSDPWAPQVVWTEDGQTAHGLHVPVWKVTGELPLDLCFDVELHLEETGEVVPGDPLILHRGKARGGYFTPKDSREFSSGVDGSVPLRVVLKPSRGLALSDLEVTKYYTGSITSDVVRARVMRLPVDSEEPWVARHHEFFEEQRSRNRGE